MLSTLISRPMGPVLLGLVLTAGCGYSLSPPETRSVAKNSPQSSEPAGLVARETGPSPSGLAPDTVQFVSGYTRGYEQAQQTGKPMLLFFKTTWCRFCREMQSDAFHDSQVQQLSKDFVCVEIDGDEEMAICGDYGVRGYPTVQFVTTNGIPINRLVGRSRAGELATQMQTALHASTETAQRTPLFAR